MGTDFAWAARYTLPCYRRLNSAVHILFEVDSPGYHLEPIKQGVSRYFEVPQPKYDFLPISLDEAIALEMKDTQIAIIGWLRSEQRLEMIRKRNIPFINLNEVENHSALAGSVEFRNEGKMAAQYFVKELDCDSLLYVGIAMFQGQRRRGVDFSDECRALGVEVERFPLALDVKLEEIPGRFGYGISNWSAFRTRLRSIKKPVGVFCSSDRLAMTVRYLAEGLGFTVPGEVNILGVGGICLYGASDIGLISIVQIDFQTQGFVAARRMVEHLETGTPLQATYLNPEGILHRSTTSRFRVSDPLIREAILAIQNDPAISIEFLCSRLRVSRSFLEKRFRGATRMTLSKAIEMQRFQKARFFLKTSSYSYDAIAGLSGYTNGKQMRRSFHRIARMSPKEYHSAMLESDDYSRNV